MRYFDVSTSCIPSSPKEKTMSTISWTCLARASTFVSASAFSRSIRGSCRARRRRAGLCRGLLRGHGAQAQDQESRQSVPFA